MSEYTKSRIGGRHGRTRTLGVCGTSAGVCVCVCVCVCVFAILICSLGVGDCCIEASCGSQAATNRVVGEEMNLTRMFVFLFAFQHHTMFVITSHHCNILFVLYRFDIHILCVYCNGTSWPTTSHTPSSTTTLSSPTYSNTPFTYR
jgi:hypothetical protein